MGSEVVLDEIMREGRCYWRVVDDEEIVGINDDNGGRL